MYGMFFDSVTDSWLTTGNSGVKGCSMFILANLLSLIWIFFSNFSRDWCFYHQYTSYGEQMWLLIRRNKDLFKWIFLFVFFFSQYLLLQITHLCFLFFCALSQCNSPKSVFELLFLHSPGFLLNWSSFDYFFFIWQCKY